jgi:tetratricopeptide (TPR) repeat protein
VEALISETPMDTLFLDRLSTHLPRSIPRSGTKNGLETRRYLHTETLLNRLIRELPERHDLLGRKASLLLFTDRPEEARHIFRQAISLESDPRYRLGIAHTYLNERDWDPAIEILDGLFGETRAESELYSQIVTALGGAYVRSNRPAQARTVYNQALVARPEELNYQLAVGRTYVVEKNWEEAIPALESLKNRLVDETELLEEVLYDLGHSYERAGRFYSAVAVFQRLLARAPDNHKALNYLGYMFAEKGERLREAEDYIKRALQGDPKNGAYLDSMGWVYFQQERYDEAMKYLKLALKAEENRLNKIEMEFRTDGQRENLSVILDHVGDAARAQGDIDEALVHWQRAVDLNPDNETIRRKLQSFGPGNANGP